jgi:beta-lactamase superfamily II metal-dependent hydrolase
MHKSLIALVCGLAGCLAAQPRPLGIYWVDVEGGGATLIVTPAGESVLIDAGEDLARDATRIFELASKHVGLKQIDHVVATHWHADHYGGVSRLHRLIPIAHFYDHGNAPSSLPDDPSVPRIMPLYQKATGGHAKMLNAGDTLPLKFAAGMPPVLLECLASNRKVAKSRAAGSGRNAACEGQPAPKPDDTDNANSLAFKLTYGQFTFFDGGDLTRDVERNLVCPANLAGSIDIYQTDGHGMDVSDDAVFLRTLHPRVVVINNGPNKGAEPETMQALWSTPGIESIWQIHRNLRNRGVRNTSPELIANQELHCSAVFLEASVQPEGDFTLQVGGSGTPRRYRRR